MPCITGCNKPNRNQWQIRLLKWLSQCNTTATWPVLARVFALHEVKKHKTYSSSRIFIQLSKTGKTKEQLLAISRRKLCFCLHPCRPRQWGWRCRCEAWPLDGSLPRTPVSTFSAFDRCCVKAEKLAILIRKYITRTTIQYIKSDRMKFAGNDLFVMENN